MLEMMPWIAVTLVALVGLLVTDRSGSLVRRGALKIMASTGFVVAAIVAGAFETAYGKVMLVGLLFSWLGDTFLLSPSAQPFRAGLLSFLFAHVAFGIAFIVLGVTLRISALALVALIPSGIVVGTWVLPRVPAGMRGPVIAYMVIISLMVALAAGTLSGGHRVILVGAVLFYLSDLSVARERFVASGFINALWGLPLYYVAQLLLAYSVILPR